MTTYYLLKFDGELMFHNGRDMQICAKFINYHNIYDVVKTIVTDKEFVYKTFFYADPDQNNPAMFSFSFYGEIL